MSTQKTSDGEMLGTREVDLVPKIPNDGKYSMTVLFSFRETGIISVLSHKREIKVENKKVPIILLYTQSAKNKNNILEQIILGFSSFLIILLCETWLKNDDSNMLLPFANAFTIYRSDQERGYGGVAILIPKSLPSVAVRKGRPYAKTLKACG